MIIYQYDITHKITVFFLISAHLYGITLQFIVFYDNSSLWQYTESSNDRKTYWFSRQV